MRASPGAARLRALPGRSGRREDRAESDGRSWKRLSGVRGYRLLRLGGSAFHGFVRDEYTTLPDIHNRPLHMWLDLEWTYRKPEQAFSGGAIPAAVRSVVRDVFERFESGSIQQVIYQMGTRILAEQPAIAEIRLEANNRTWDTVAEQGDEAGRVHRCPPALWLPGPEAAAIRWRRLSTHVLDTARGAPARGCRGGTVCGRSARGGDHRDAAMTNADGRTDEPLLIGRAHPAGIYELGSRRPSTSARAGATLDDPPFLDDGGDPVRHRRSGRALSCAAADFAIRLHHVPGLLDDTAEEIIARCRRSRSSPRSPDSPPALFSPRPCATSTRWCGEWMESAGMRVRVDDGGQYARTLRGPHRMARRLYIGSHLDTVPRAGAFDGIARRRASGSRWSSRCRAGGCDSHIEVVGFSEEEGVRFGVPFIGSRALVGRSGRRSARDGRRRRRSRCAKRFAPSAWIRAHWRGARRRGGHRVSGVSHRAGPGAGRSGIAGGGWWMAIVGQSRLSVVLSRQGESCGNHAHASAARRAGRRGRVDVGGRADGGAISGMVATVGPDRSACRARRT